jgi:proline dehydrogenase
MLSLYRRTVLGVAHFLPVERLLRRHGHRLGARRFVAGHSVAEALPALAEIVASGRSLLVDVLGEYVRSADDARSMQASILATLDDLHAHDHERVVSVKPTQLGLGLDPALAEELALDVALRAEGYGGRIALDMEDARFTDATLALLRSLWRGGATRSSTVLQAYLPRSPDDLGGLIADAPDPRSLEVRIVKGAYQEDPVVAYQDLPTIRRAFVALCERTLLAGARANVATHDERLLAETLAFARGADAGDRVELQLLYGVKPRLQASLVAEGHRVRVYTPIGHDWYGYYSRRLAERPANLALVLRGLAG